MKNEFQSSHRPGYGEYLNWIMSGAVRPKLGPLDRNPCANIVVANTGACPNPGTMGCSGCRLVSYCSKECQKAHWKKHKKDCHEEIRTDEWRPAWEKEKRIPSFITPTGSNLDIPDSPFSTGMALWGNTPAIDLVNLAANENDLEKDLNLAFVASGDLRHVLKTINSLPAEYKGRLNILVNDFNPVVASRNIAILAVLGQVTDEALAADVALHFWYSVLLPSEYRSIISVALSKFLESHLPSAHPSTSPNSDALPSGMPIGTKSVLNAPFFHSLKPFLMHATLPGEDGELERAQAEYLRLRELPSRRDLRDRMYSRLRPSHRLAFREYRRHGIVLPFGATKTHFNVPNRSLFSFDGAWLQTDFADPLEGWDLNEVVAIGRDYGAHAEDIYGCFYFFIFNQLKALWNRLRTLNISFVLTSTDATALANGLLRNELKLLGLSPQTGFDRIHVSNILDTMYVGLSKVVGAWAPLLSVSRAAVIVGYFMNWVGSQKGGRVVDLPEKEVRRLMNKMMEDGRSKLKTYVDAAKSQTSHRAVPKSCFLYDVQVELFFMMSNIDFIHDNSTAFSAFLKNQGLDGLMRKHGLKMRRRHTIVPHRIGAPVAGNPGDIPQFIQEDSWYYQASMLCNTGFERFVEFSSI